MSGAMIDWNESPTVTHGGGFAASITFAMQRATNSGFGAAFIDYYAHIKDAEIERFRKEAREQSEVTPWEQKEYLDLF